MPGIPVKVLLVEDNPGDARLFQEYLTGPGSSGFELQWVVSAALAAETLSQRQFDVVVLDLSLPDSKGLETFEKLRKTSHKGPIIVLSGMDDEELALQAVREGAQDYLVKGKVDQSSLARAIRYAIERHQRQPAAKTQRRAKVVSFIGANGGAGTTSVAINVASVWAREGRSVICCELRPSPGTLARQLAMSPAVNLSSLLDTAPDAINDRDLSACLSRLPSGLRVFFGPQHPNEYRDIDADHARAIVNAMANSAEFVVLDLPIHHSEGIRAALQSSEYAVLVLETDPLSAAAAKTTLEFLEYCGLGRKVIGAVAVHRTALVSALSVNDIRNQVGCPLIGVAPPAADALVAAHRAGTPLVASRPESNYSVAIARLAGRLTQDPVPPFDA